MTKRLVRLAALAAAAAAFALPAAPANAEWCVIQEPTIYFYVCV